MNIELKMEKSILIIKVLNDYIKEEDKKQKGKNKGKLNEEEEEKSDKEEEEQKKDESDNESKEGEELEGENVSGQEDVVFKTMYKKLREIMSGEELNDNLIIKDLLKNPKKK